MQHFVSFPVKSKATFNMLKPGASVRRLVGCDVARLLGIQTARKSTSTQIDR